MSHRFVSTSRRVFCFSGHPTARGEATSAGSLASTQRTGAGDSALWMLPGVSGSRASLAETTLQVRSLLENRVQHLLSDVRLARS